MDGPRRRVERAALGDLAEVLALERETAEAPHWDGAAYRAALDRDGDAPQRRLVVERGAEGLLGFAVARVVAGVGEIESVAVRASARRRGVGRALCEAVIAWAWEQGADAVELEVRASSGGARAMYRALGFVECGRRRGYYGDPVDDAVLMQKTRDAPSFPARSSTL